MITSKRDISRTAPLAVSPPLSTTISRYVSAGRHLRTKQALHWLLRRSFGRRYHVPPAAYVAVRAGATMATMAATAPTGLTANTFSFLQDQHIFPGAIDWHLVTKSRLWAYNLHYFDYTLDPSRDADWTMQTMLHWIAAVPPGKCVGWEPYPTSLRIVNWIKFAFTQPQPNILSQPWQVSLYQQAAWLERNIEHEIQANHLLKNAKALIFAGTYFAGPIADGWALSGLALLLRECREQFLSDGGHYERSAMYHAIALEDLLDVISLIRSNPRLASTGQTAELRRIAEVALAYLVDMTYPGGAIPMFNDSANGLAKTSAALVRYGRILTLKTPLPRKSRIRVIRKSAAGYYGYRLGSEMLVVDAGPIGPSHQPGHGHCDMLSLELMLHGRLVLVNSGIYDYEDTPVRTMLRQTAAHNTVRLDRLEQSDVWGCFRVGRRALPGPTVVGLTQSDDQSSTRFRFAGSHQGYRHLTGRPTHHRTINCDVGRHWRVTDEIHGHGRHHLENFIHFHPDMQLQRSGQDWIVIDEISGSHYRFGIFGGQAELLQTFFCPSFGTMQRNTTACLSTTATLPHAFGYWLGVI